jgi:hypothetical protein
MPREGFKPATPATKRQQTYVLDSAATGSGEVMIRSSSTDGLFLHDA